MPANKTCEAGENTTLTNTPFVGYMALSSQNITHEHTLCWLDYIALTSELLGHNVIDYNTAH